MPAVEPGPPAESAEGGPLELGHPKGTLVIVALYALLFALGCIGYQPF
jgi:hypothetical protein